MKINEPTIDVVRDSDGAERPMSRTQWAAIGSDPDTNGGWRQKSAKPAEIDTDHNELALTQTRYFELTGKKPGTKKLETLKAEIEDIQNPKVGTPEVIIPAINPNSVTAITNNEANQS